MSSAQTQVPAQTGWFGDQVVAMVLVSPTALVFAPASAAASTAASPFAEH